MRYAISSCLMGINCKYNGGNNLNRMLFDFMQNKPYILICPEILGGLSTPMESVELYKSTAITKRGEDKSEAFIKGAYIALQQLIAFQADIVITQSRSPSCGFGSIYDGTFSKSLIKGNGMFADLVLKKGIMIMDIQQFLETIS